MFTRFGYAFEALIPGTPGRDLQLGKSPASILEGSSGADVLIGATGRAFVDYSRSPEAVVLSLHLVSGSGGDAEGDSYSEISGPIGSDHGDVFHGYRAWTGTFFRDVDKNEVFIGRGGDDVAYGYGGGTI